MSVRLIAEMGSTHQGKFTRIIEAIDRCKKLGIDALKLQLFPDEAPYTKTKTESGFEIQNGNVYLPREMFREAFYYGKSIGLPVSASVFTEDDEKFLLDLKPKFIKYSYSKSGMTLNKKYPDQTEVIISLDMMKEFHGPGWATKLYCIPEYPVRYIVDFADLFKPYHLRNYHNDGWSYSKCPKFDGFSDHTLGVHQTKRAIEAGAMIIEKHCRLGYDDEHAPDAKFAVTFEEFASVR